MKTVAIVQARMGSSRLPGKCLLPLAGKTSLDWTILRVMAAKCVDEMWVATTTNPTDVVIEEHVKRKWDGVVKVFRGSEEDVLGRTCECAIQAEADIIVDSTSDCPMIDPKHIDHLYSALKKRQCDYASNVMVRSFPDGCDTQLYTMDALLKLIALGETALNREHSGWNFVTNKEPFNTFHLHAPKFLRQPSWRWTLDLPDDWKRLEFIITEMVIRYGGLYSVEKIPEVLGLDDLDPNIVKEMMGCS